MREYARRVRFLYRSLCRATREVMPSACLWFVERAQADRLPLLPILEDFKCDLPVSNVTATLLPLVLPHALSISLTRNRTLSGSAAHRRHLRARLGLPRSPDDPPTIEEFLYSLISKA